MARQNTAPVSFNRSVRSDDGVLMSSGRAGDVRPVAYIPLLRGDSASGRISIDMNLAEMPRPLLNAVVANVQAWFVPKSAFPQFAGTDEFLNSYMGTNIEALGQPSRVPPPFYITGVNTPLLQSEFAKQLGIHLPAGATINTDIIDAFVLVYNFRLAAHSSKLARRKYYSENTAEAMGFPRAFWPVGRFSGVVPDYERALIMGALELDVSAGKLPVRGMLLSAAADPTHVNATGWRRTQIGTGNATSDGGVTAMTNSRVLGAEQNDAQPRVWADMGEQTVITTLADIDKARTTQAFAKLRTAYAGNNTSGFLNDDMIVAHLMQGLSVPDEQFRRPWLLASQRVPFGFAERFASDGASLDQSVTTGRVSVNLGLNVPGNDVGGYIVVTVEVLPERIYERQTDEYWLIDAPADLPDALRDVQRTEPVDQVLNRRLDAKHTAPTALYGFESMNDVWNRAFTKLGGVFYQPTPGAPTTEARAAIWMPQVVNPIWNSDHFLAPTPFPHDVFADTAAPAYELVARHTLKIVGLTQIGDVLQENNDDYDAVKNDDQGA